MATSSCLSDKEDRTELRDCIVAVEEVHNKTVELTTVEATNNQILGGMQNETANNTMREVTYERKESIIKSSMEIVETSVSNCKTVASKNGGDSDSTNSLTKPNDSEVVSYDLHEKSRNQSNVFKKVVNSVGKEHSSEAGDLTTGYKSETRIKMESTNCLHNDGDKKPDIVASPLSEIIKPNSNKDIYWSIDKLKEVTKKLDGIGKKSNKAILCSVHSDILTYWCLTCKKAKCEKCLNIFYSKSCVDHSITTLQNHATTREKNYKVLIKEKSSACLKAMDQTLKNLNADYQKAELLVLTQEERIKQEFVSFHALLLEGENDILNCLRQCFEQYKVQNTLGQSRCGDVIAEEAELTCKLEDQESNLLTKIQNMDILMNKWSILGKKAVSMAKIPFPSQLQDRFTLFQEKTYIQKRLSVFSDRLELRPTHFTLFLSGSTLESPLHVSDLFECNNSTYSFDDIEVDIEICQNRKVLQCLRLGMNDDVCNSNERLHLIENSRYLVRAKLVVEGIINDNLGKNYRNVFIVTGFREISNRNSTTTYIIRHIESIRRDKNRKRCNKTTNSFYQNIKGIKTLFIEWKKTGMWLFSCTKECKDFFDISPEELRVLAYTMDKATYDSIVVYLEDGFRNHCEHLKKLHGFYFGNFTSFDFQMSDVTVKSY